MARKLIIVPLLVLLLPLALSLGKNTNLNKRSDISSGEKVPELALQNLEGDTIRLEDLRGKLVLVYFWASWCKPCKRELPQYVKLYKQYKDASFKNGEDGFAIYSISLDNKKKRWKQASKQFDLPWDTDVSDLKRWDSKAVDKFGIGSIPRSFLVNGNGVVKGKDVKEQLPFMLKQLKK